MKNKTKWLVIGAIVWILVGCALLGTYRFFDWRVLEGFATWVLVGGIATAIWQIIETRKSTNAQIAVELFRELRNKEAINRLRYIYSLQHTEDGKNLKPEQKADIDHVLDRLTLLGTLVEKGIIDESLAIDGFGGPAVLRCWYRLHAYIRNIQQERGYYVLNFEGFVRRSLDYFIKEDIPVFFEEGKENKRVNLVEELQNQELKPRSLKEIRNARKRTSKTSIQIKK